jgi:acyl-CoA reductase-like NAD-dependent aldehyde dehydrogenase
MTDKFKILSPFDGHLISEIPWDDAKKLEHMLATTHRLAGNPDKAIPVPQRIAILALIDSRVELDRAVQGIREAARSISQLTGREIPMNLTDSSLNRMAYTRREPIGVVAAVSAFNHPFNLIVHQVIPAVATGCPVIVKPALTTPLSCFNLVNCLYEAGLPKEWCHVLVCDNDVAEKLVTDSRVAFFSFIGSAKVGWHLRSQLAPGTRCALEHGGAAPVIMDADADVEDALPLLAKGAFYHAGQVCVSVQRVFAHKSIVKSVADGLADIAKRMVVGDPTHAATEVGPLILEQEVGRVAQWVKQAQAAGAKALTGGNKFGVTCYAPTVLLNPPDQAKVSREEIFGPVVCVYSFKDRLEAIERANQIPYAFQAAVFTKNIDAVLDSAKRLNAAAVMVNDHTAFRVDWMPFAGRKASGLGVGGIMPTMLEMTEEKMIVFRSPGL